MQKREKKNKKKKNKIQKIRVNINRQEGGKIKFKRIGRVQSKSK
jgi:uncharacterized protein involved in tellurium resistance